MDDRIGPRLEAPPTRDSLRDVLGRFPTGVTIVTSTHDGEDVGFTCQSFASVSLDPALVMFCANSSSETWRRIRASGVFTVNVLANVHDKLCMRFAARGLERFADRAWTRTPWGPALPDAVATISCEITASYTAGDHDIAIGSVRQLESSADRHHCSTSAAACTRTASSRRQPRSEAAQGQTPSSLLAPTRMTLPCACTRTARFLMSRVNFSVRSLSVAASSRPENTPTRPTGREQPGRRLRGGDPAGSFCVRRCRRPRTQPETRLR